LNAGRVGEITLDDGVCIGEEEEAVQAQVPSPGPVDLGMTTAGCGVGSACRGQRGGNGEPVICGDTVETRSVGERVQHGTVLVAKICPHCSAWRTRRCFLVAGSSRTYGHAFRAFGVGGSVDLHGGRRKSAWGGNNGGRSSAHHEGEANCHSRMPLAIGPDSRGDAETITSDGVDKLSMNVVGEESNGMANTSAFELLVTSYHSLGQSDD